MSPLKEAIEMLDQVIGLSEQHGVTDLTLDVAKVKKLREGMKALAEIQRKEMATPIVYIAIADTDGQVNVVSTRDIIMLTLIKNENGDDIARTRVQLSTGFQFLADEDAHTILRKLDKAK